MMAPVIVCVVETGMPQTEAAMTVAAAPVSAQKPEKGLSFVIRLPIVRTIRQPPVNVPRPIAACAERMIHQGTTFRSGRCIQWNPDAGSAKGSGWRPAAPR